MGKRKQIKQDKELSFIGAYSGATTELSIAPKRDRQEKDISSYPSPRSYSEEYLKSRQEAGELMPKYKAEIVKALQDRQKYSLSDKQAKEIEDKIIIIQDGKADAILSTLSHSATGVTMDRVLRAIPELLYRENTKLKTLSEGTAYRAISPKEDTQLSLFVEAEEKALSTGTAILRYSSREWAKLIYNKSNPLPKEEGFIDRVVEQLSETKIYYPLGGGKYAYMPLIWRSNTGVLDTQDADGLSYEYIRLHPLFTLALTEGKRGTLGDRAITWHAPIKVVGSVLTKTIEYRLLERLEYLYSYAHSAIKAKAATGEIEMHSEGKDALLSLVSTADAASLKKNKSRIIKDILTAFAKMEEIGIIAKGTFKEDRLNYRWGWSPDYLKK